MPPMGCGRPATRSSADRAGQPTPTPCPPWPPADRLPGHLPVAAPHRHLANLLHRRCTAQSLFALGLMMVILDLADGDRCYFFYRRFWHLGKVFNAD